MRKWLFTPTNNKVAKLLNVFILLIFMLLWVYGFNHLYEKLYNIQIFKTFPEFEYTPVSNVQFFILVFLAPAVEELKYRYAPIMLGKIFSQNLILPIIVLTSIIFAESHDVNPIYRIFIQGVFGFGLSILFVKNNYSYKSSFLAHSLWNLLTLFVSF